MCRLFGMTTGARPTHATFWLLEASDSLSNQSRRNPDGYGVATYEADGSPRVDKRPAAAYEDEQFAREAKELESTTFVAHVRYASSGGLSLENTHPFEQRGRVFAHNGHIGQLPQLDAHLGSYRELIHGETDSERFFALITKETDEHGGDVGAGIVAAAGWIAEQLPVFALNCVLATQTELWALRYPATHPLMVLERGIGGPTGARHLDAASAAGTVRVRSAALRSRGSVIVASEQMDEDHRWRTLDAGELISVDREMRVSTVLALAKPPAHPILLADLEPAAASSQRD